MKGIGMIDIEGINILSNNKSTLRATSKDDSNEVFLTESTLEVVNFDKVKKEYIRNFEIAEEPASVDALYSDGNGELYFIEFKNGYISKEKSYEIWLKIFDSLLIFSDIVGEDVSFTRVNMNFILVYNEGKNSLPNEMTEGMQVSPSRERIASFFIEKRARRKFIRFNLERFDELYFKGVYTYTQEVFESNFVHRLSS